MKRQILVLVGSVVLGFLVGGPIWANVIYVDASATGPNNGTNWTDAYTHIQLALSRALSGDEIWVAARTPYQPTAGTDRTISFMMRDGVSLYGGFTGNETSRDQRDWVANETILSGDIGTVGDDSDNSFHVVTGANNATLDGFTITGGNANGGSWYSHGGGMRQMSFESMGIIRPDCPARPAATRFRRAFVRPILTRPPIRATQPSSLLQLNVNAFSYGMNIGLPIGKESLTKQKKDFPLELRAKTSVVTWKS